MKVSAILKGRTDTNGHRPVQIRIAQGKKRTYKPTRIKINPKLFHGGKVDLRHPKAKEYNQLLETLKIQYQAQALEGFRKKRPKTEFFPFAQKTIPTLQRHPSTIRYYNSQLQKLREYNSCFTFQDIDKNFLNGYKEFLKARGNEGNTIWSAFKFLKTFVKIATMEGLVSNIRIDSVKYVDPEKNYLTEREIKSIDKFITPKCPEKIFHAGTWFLIACYTGLRLSDLKAFSKKNIVSDRLVIRTQKTKEMVGLPLSPRLKRYFQRVDYKFKIHENTYNELIKIIAAAVGISKHISSHTARHTAAMMLANAGVSQEVTAKILGHSSLKSTSVYYKISNVRIDAEMRKLK